MIKKYISILLVSLLIFNSFGYFVAYYQLQFIFKNIGYDKISHILPEDQLTTLRIPIKEITEDNNFIQFEESEISYYGHMYDICKQDTVGDAVVFYCYSDDNEDVLQTAFISFVKQNTDSGSSTPVANILKQLIKITGYIINLNEFSNINISQYSHILNQGNYYSISLDVLTPPPRNI